MTNFQDIEIDIIKRGDWVPTKVGLDICNLCQLDCAACWMRKNKKLIKQKYGGFGYVKFETFINFINKNSFIKEIDLSNNGEIFLNPDLYKIIIYAYYKGIKLTAFNGVNLNYLQNNIAEALVKYKFNGLTVSIDAATPETYAIYRRNGDFNKVIENIKLINYYKEKYNSELPYLTYKFILFGHNEHEIEKAKKLAKELNMNINFEVNFAPKYSPIKNKEKVIKETGISNISSHIENYYNKGFNGYCKDLFLSPIINYNGDFLGCSTALSKTFKINVFEEGLINALYNEKVLYAKQMLLDYSVKPRKDIPCTHCYVYKFLRDNNYTLF